MTARTGVDAAHYEQADRGTDELPMFATPEQLEECRHEAPTVPLSDRERRRVKRMQARDNKMQRWIDLGMPVALEVARAKGKVTAATFRAEAKLRKVLPPIEEDRTLSYIPSIFAALVATGKLDVQRHPNGDAVKLYDPETRNSHVCYVPRAG